MCAAINIEHHIERTVSFVIIVFGELVISVVYHAMEATIGLSVYVSHSSPIYPPVSPSELTDCYRVYGRAVLGLIIAFNLAWIYWDVEASGTFVHALRRHCTSRTLCRSLSLTRRRCRVYRHNVESTALAAFLRPNPRERSTLPSCTARGGSHTRTQMVLRCRTWLRDDHARRYRHGTSQPRAARAHAH